MAGDEQSQPNFTTKSEETFWRKLRSQSIRGEEILGPIRFSDSKYGDVEADFIILMPELGAAVVEVKGGRLERDGDRWVATNGSYRRRTDPFDQARRAKHALRRFLDRQPEWQQGLLRTQWFVALPNAEFDGDLGPEGRREQILDCRQVEQALPLIRQEMKASLSTEPLPVGDWVPNATTLLSRLPIPAEDQIRRRPWVTPLLTIAAVLVGLIGVGLVTARFGWPGAIAGTVAAVTGFGLAGRQLCSTCSSSTRSMLVPAVAALIGSIFAIALVAAFYKPTLSTEACQPGYLPCLPMQVDLDCTEIKAKVQIFGEDVYGLDRDGDGFGCESYE